MTKVIFRKFKCGDVIALFPQEPATLDGYLCVSYMHVGQHSAVSPSIVRNTKPASVEEYRNLLWELEQVGYNDLVVCKRFTRNDYITRKGEASL